MGGQACVWYGGAEFSRDIDVAIVADPTSMEALARPVTALDARPVAVPPFEAAYLHRGLALHFRCQRKDVRDLELVVRERMHGVDAFASLWDRRTTIEVEDVGVVELFSLPDLIGTLKTYRAEDWDAIRRLIERSFEANRQVPTSEQIEFWFREARSPYILLDLARTYPFECEQLMQERPLLKFAIAGNESALVRELFHEQQVEMEADREYWKPLRAELEAMRRERLGQ